MNQFWGRGGRNIKNCLNKSSGCAYSNLYIWVCLFLLLKLKISLLIFVLVFSFGNFFSFSRVCVIQYPFCTVHFSLFIIIIIQIICNGGSMIFFYCLNIQQMNQYLFILVFFFSIWFMRCVLYTGKKSKVKQKNFLRN